MSQVVEFVNRIFREEDGQDMVEYGVLLGLLAIAAVGIAAGLGTRVGEIWTAIQTALQ